MKMSGRMSWNVVRCGGGQRILAEREEICLGDRGILLRAAENSGM